MLSAPTGRGAGAAVARRRAPRGPAAAAAGKCTLIAEIEPEHLALLRDLMADDISLDRAVYEISAAHRAEQAVAAATLAAAEYLIRENDAERLRKWLDQHTAHERAAILRHLQQRKKVRPCQKRT